MTRLVVHDSHSSLDVSQRTGPSVMRGGQRHTLDSDFYGAIPEGLNRRTDTALTGVRAEGCQARHMVTGFALVAWARDEASLPGGAGPERDPASASARKAPHEHDSWPMSWSWEIPQNKAADNCSDTSFRSQNQPPGLFGTRSTQVPRQL